MGGEITWSNKLSKTEDEETSSRNLEKPGERSVGVGIQVYRHTHTQTRLCPNTKSGRTPGVTYRRQKKSEQTLKEMKSVTLSSLSYLSTFSTF